MAAGENVNVAVTPYVTTQARLKLYEYLRELGDSVRYCDSDLQIYIRNVDDAPEVKTGNYLGQFTDELVFFGFRLHTEEFGFGGPKSHVFCTTEHKVKGINLKNENSKSANVNAFWNMTLKNTTHVHVHKPRNIKRNMVVEWCSKSGNKNYSVAL